MQTGITRSVGRYGINDKDDVMFVQSALNNYAKKYASNSFPLKVDGVCGAKTTQAIYNFQKNHLGIAAPDARIDPNGKTLRHLINPQATSVAAAHPLVSNTSNSQNFSGINVSYASDIAENRRVVSAYAIQVVKLALFEAGMNHAVITSTLRTPEDQAEIMYKNAKTDIAQQQKLYGDYGDSVLDIYQTNKAKSKDAVIKLMKEKIENLLKNGHRVSNHCITMDSFKSLNSFDIGVKSTKDRSNNFDKKGLTNAFLKLVRQGYIKKFHDETMLKNNCWHLEITPHVKSINLYQKESMLAPLLLTSSRYV